MTLEEMKNQDIRKVDRKDLKERSSVQIDEKLPRKERLCQYLKQMGNPYCYLDDGVVVKVSFSNTSETIEDRMKAYIRSL